MRDPIGLTNNPVITSKQGRSLLTRGETMQQTCMVTNVSTTAPVWTDYGVRPQQFLNFLPLPQGQASLRPTLAGSRRAGISS